MLLNFLMKRLRRLSFNQTFVSIIDETPEGFNFPITVFDLMNRGAVPPIYQRYTTFCNTLDIYYNFRPIISIVKRNNCITLFIVYHVGLPMDGGSQIRLFIFRLRNIVFGRIKSTTIILNTNAIFISIWE